jgi:hypothetical protein
VLVGYLNTMSITVKKAGEAAAKAVQKKGEKMVLRPPRAVTAAEADTIQPARESTTISMTPWAGWIQRWFKDSFGEERYQQFRSTLFFMPDDIYDLQQNPKPTQKIPISKTDPSITAMYRYPSPGSQKPPRMPEWEEGQDPFDSGYFKRDTRRRYLNSELGDPALEKAKLALMDPNDPAVQEEKKKLEAGPESSQGNKGVFATGPSDFDPTGLRATMSVSWEKLEKSLDDNMPDHLPTPVWMGKEEEIIEWYTSRDLPVPIGGFYAPNKVPVYRRVARW